MLGTAFLSKCPGSRFGVSSCHRRSKASSSGSRLALNSLYKPQSLRTCDPPASASQTAGMTGPYH